jgi:hypothetical protein
MEILRYPSMAVAAMMSQSNFVDGLPHGLFR